MVYRGEVKEGWKGRIIEEGEVRMHSCRERERNSVDLRLCPPGRDWLSTR